MVKISACLVIRNEEDLIGRALDSVKGVVDEIIVVHSGKCTDTTLDIARKYTHKVFIAPDRGAGCYNRPFAFAQATGDWIIYIDADEYLSDELRGKLRQLSLDETVDGYRFLHEVMVGFKPLKYAGHRLCMFRKSKGSVKGFIHEEVRVKGRVKSVNLVLHHRPDYDNYTMETFNTKWMRWAKIQARDMVEDGRAKYPGFLYFPASLLLPVYVFSRDLFKGNGLNNGKAGIRIAYLQALYNFQVYWNIFKIKIGKPSDEIPVASPVAKN